MGSVQLMAGQRIITGDISALADVINVVIMKIYIAAVCVGFKTPHYNSINDVKLS